MEVSLEEMLTARERRVERQRELVARYARPLICFTMNIAGGVKRNGAIDASFLLGMKELRGRAPVMYEERVFERTGCTGYAVCDCGAEALKALAVELEDATPCGRLYDIDVLDERCRKLSRREPRRCLVCDELAAACARSRRHSATELYVRATELASSAVAAELGRMARGALLFEVDVTPKPGLVDRRNSGAHRDMDADSFYRSAAALEPYFERIAAVSMRAEEAAELPDTLRAIGVEAEAAMLRATGGANTHRGAIYTLGLLVAGGAAAIARSEVGRAPETAAGLARMLESGRALRVDDATNGGRVRREYGVGGIQAEAMNGFPTVLAAEAELSRRIAAGATQNDAAVATLLWIIARLDDTNLLHRGGADGAAYAKSEAARVLGGAHGGIVAQTELLDCEFTRRNLSPGGSADVLAAAALLREFKALFT
ncbi:MAG: citrate lyase holo-[acyl-carrier protein] synthase [Clostridia bacterium]|nr:citrate lyase holo-[acyl-carrier protein] synthase [Clostridia bacterium]